MQTENKLSLDIKHYIDSDYSAESNFRYKYYLVIAQNQMISVLADEQINRIVSIKTYSNKLISFLDMSYNDLKEFTEITDDFIPTYKSKTAIIANDSSILVPDSLNNINELEAYYKINKNTFESSQILYNRIDFQGIVNVFNIRNEISKFIRFNMPTAEIIHQSLLFIKACSYLNFEPSANNLYLHINADSIELLQFIDGDLNFYNSFKFDNQTDIVYYILAVAEQLNITNDFRLIIYGNIESSDSLFALLGKYCKNMHLGKRNSRFTIPMALENVPEHYYFTALNVLLCE
jgi:Protein of unknown function (DUF3822)